MANTISTTGTLTTVMGALRVTGDLTLSKTLSGSNVTANVQNIALSSWQGLDTSSLSDVRYAYVSNDGSGSVKLATDGAGANVIAVLQTDDWVFLPWSGSTGLYAQAYTSASVITTIITEA
jgi:hypothetical protein